MNGMQLMRMLAILGGAAAAAAGCGVGPSAGVGAGEQGTIRMALTSTASSTTYVLANATFGVTPIQPASDAALFLHQSDPTAGDLTATVPVGRYSVNLNDGWQLEREDSPTTLVPVHATLQSINPVTISVFSGQTTTATFQFQTNGIPLTFGPGSIDIGIQTSTCDAQPPPGVELNVIANPDFEVGAMGWVTGIDDLTPLGLSPTAHCGLHSGRATLPHATYDLPNPATMTTYAFSAWVRHSEPQALNLGLSTSVSGSPACRLEPFQQIAVQAVAPDTWTRLSGTGSAGSQCGASSAALIVYVDAPAVSELLVDDVYAIPQ